MKQKSNHFVDGQSHDLQSLMQKVLDFAKHKGASQAQVGVSHDNGFSVDVRNGEADKVEFSKDNGVGVTVYLGNKKGHASTSDVSDDALSNTVDAALDIARLSAEDSCYGLPESALIEKEYPEISLYYPWSITPEEALARAVECEQEALGYDERIVMSEGASVSSYEFHRGLANSHGFMGMTKSSRHSMSCVLVAKDTKGLQRDYDFTTARDAKHLENSSVLAKNAAEKTVSRLDSRKVDSGQYPVLFNNQVSTSLISSLIAAIRGGNLYRKNTFLLDSLGKSIAPSFFSMYEEPHLQGALGSAPYDGDGLITRNNCFVDEGIVTNYVLDTYTARRLSMQTTANSGGVHNLTVKDTGHSFDDLVRQMDKGIIVTDLMGQGINITTGDYSRGAQGFWVEGGEILYPIDEFTVAGNLSDMIKNILAIGLDIDVRRATRCGSILIESMMVGGQ